METLIAFAVWLSVFMIIYACGNICELIALKLKFHKSSWYFWLAGLVAGIFLIAETEFPNYQNMSWVEEHLLASDVIFSTWWLGLLSIFGWSSAIWRISSCLYRNRTSGV